VMSVLRVILAADACPSTESLKETVGHGVWWVVERDLFSVVYCYCFVCS